MSSLAGLPFRKMNGLGNDFVIVDLRGTDARMTPEAARAIADRQSGIGCDQVITIEDRGGPFMGVWNADGSAVEACGNAARCVGWLLMEEQDADEARFAAPAGPLRAWRAGPMRVTIDMGEPKFHWRDIPLAEQFEDTRFIDVKLGPIDRPVLWGPSAVNMGNPHCIFFVDDAEAQALDRFGPLVENHPLFPERTNVGVAQVKGAHLIRLRVWERGAGVTKACGTAACAALVAAHRRRLTARKATLELDGGPLAVEWGEDNRVRMTGAVAHEFDGTLPHGL
ncbi:diaminopimelate epimerase [Amphiplicatus metriothermophilus]|uniref:Diaminopimelate epimerase n=1 Tax=Amphiplicatus metriothermophilus TaxID=1519374 RepID=A0A239PME5_9PROT|nr:diaminopimelate epimerase [Amphiplicatus metriothermophilus]MBB5517391.1 diaminopimelate epimerase [Amphiplicatus metriothermophilus]SNT68274.1 diaminopimelate epimerase [Amphiplicatus metriothermophilus]